MSDRVCENNEICLQAFQNRIQKETMCEKSCPASLFSILLLIGKVSIFHLVHRKQDTLGNPVSKASRNHKTRKGKVSFFLSKRYHFMALVRFLCGSVTFMTSLMRKL